MGTYIQLGPQQCSLPPPCPKSLLRLNPHVTETLQLRCYTRKQLSTKPGPGQGESRVRDDAKAIRDDESKPLANPTCEIGYEVAIDRPERDEEPLSQNGCWRATFSTHALRILCAAKYILQLTGNWV